MTLRKNEEEKSDERYGIENIARVLLGDSVWREGKWKGLFTYELVGLCIAEIMLERSKSERLRKAFKRTQEELKALQQLDLGFFPPSERG